MTRDELLRALMLERYGPPVHDVPRRAMPATTDDLLQQIATARAVEAETAAENARIKARSDRARQLMGAAS